MNPTVSAYPVARCGVSGKIQKSSSLQIEDSPPKIWRAGPPPATGSFNLLDLTPEARVLSGVGKDGLVTLHVPKFRSRALQSLLLRCRISPTVHVRLDEFGSSFWKLADGSRNIGEIGREMQSRFGDRVQPVYERLAIFIRQMKAYRYISLK